MSSAQQQDTDDAYDSNFGSDPGHISRAELRFNAALQAAGVTRGGMVAAPARRGRVLPRLKAAPGAGRNWVAYPESGARGAKEDVTINIYKQQALRQAAVRQRQARPRSMSAAEARSDLFGYFDGITSQVAYQERKHARQVLDRLGSEEKGAGREGSSAHMQARGRRGPRAARGEGESILRLLDKAMKTGEWQRDVKKTI